MGLEIESLTINYDKTSVVWDVTAKFEPGRIVCIVGPNGAGKTTFLKACAGLEQPLSGSILLGGKPINSGKRRVVYVPQRESIDWDFPIRAIDLVLMGRYDRLGLFKWPRRADRQAAMDALKDVGMEAFADRQIGELSGGQQQRLFIARALLQEGDLYLFDEPFAAIDQPTEHLLMKLFKKLKEQKKCVLVVHHDLSSCREYFDDALLLNTALVASGPVAKVLTQKNLSRAYGIGYSILDAATRLENEVQDGDRS